MGAILNPALLTSLSQEWRTPQEFLKIVREFDDIALDPATTVDNPTGAARGLTRELNGLRHNWAPLAAGGLTFVNPPFGRALNDWAYKFARDGEVTELITLTPARTDTKWFQNYMVQANTLFFLRGRMRFHHQQPDGSWAAGDAAPFPCLVSYWGKRRQKFINVFSPLGGWIP
jgi:hypothetical protein